MMPWNQVEAPPELRKWKPRQVSPEVRARLFGAGACVAAVKGQAAESHFAELGRWLVPAFACFLLVLATLSDRLPARYAAQFRAENPGSAALTQENGMMILPASTAHSGAQSGVNAIPSKKLEWSFGARSAATGVSSFLISYTNKLIQ